MEMMEVGGDREDGLGERDGGGTEDGLRVDNRMDGWRGLVGGMDDRWTGGRGGEMGGGGGYGCGGGVERMDGGDRVCLCNKHQ